MKIMAIPRALLPHTAVLKPPPGYGAFAEIPSDGTVLRFVRVEPRRKIRLSDNDNAASVSAVMYYDCENSLPPGLEFNAGDIIRTGGSDLVVSEARAVTGADCTHHYRLELV